MLSKYYHLKDEIIKCYVEENLSIREIKDKLSIKSKTAIQKLIGDKIRSNSEAIKLGHKKYPNSFLHTSETKDRLREKRLNYLKNHPECTAWRKKNMSYPEKMFIKYILDRELDKKYLIEREKSFFPYYVDFAFINIKVAVEIDGSQHLLPERKINDNNKDELLNSLGWKVIRISEDTVKNDWKNIDEILLNIDYEILDNTTKIGIFKSTKKYQKKERDINGRTSLQNISSMKQRKVERPSKELLYDLIKTKSFVEIGKTYNVSDKAIVKWCKYYKLPFRKKDIK